MKIWEKIRKSIAYHYLGCAEFLSLRHIGPEENLLLLRWLRFSLSDLSWSGPARGRAEQGAEEWEGGEGRLGAGWPGEVAGDVYKKQYDLHGVAVWCSEGWWILCWCLIHIHSTSQARVHRNNRDKVRLGSLANKSVIATSHLQGHSYLI